MSIIINLILTHFNRSQAIKYDAIKFECIERNYPIIYPSIAVVCDTE